MFFWGQLVRGSHHTVVPEKSHRIYQPKSRSACFHDIEQKFSVNAITYEVMTTHAIWLKLFPVIGIEEIAMEPPVEFMRPISSEELVNVVPEVVYELPVLFPGVVQCPW